MSLYGQILLPKQWFLVPICLLRPNHTSKRQVRVIFSPTRPSGPSWSSSQHVRVSVGLCVPFPCNFFWGLSLVLRSHDQIPASHWSTILPYHMMVVVVVVVVVVVELRSLKIFKFLIWLWFLIYGFFDVLKYVKTPKTFKNQPKILTHK